MPTLEKKKPLYCYFFYYLRRLFLNGLFAILPITLTIALFNLSFRLISDWLKPLSGFVQQTFFKHVPYAEIIVAIAIIFVVGFIYNVFILRSLINLIEKLIFTVPLVRPVYSGIKQLVQAFSMQGELTFKKVVIVEFPRKGVYSLGFLTRTLHAEIAPHGKLLYNVFIPTTPNPTSGYLVIIPQEDVMVVDLTHQEAMAMIISGGIIQPERFNK